MSHWLQTERLTKVYGGRRVVDGLDLSADLGRVLGLLGPNGAGKTTTLRMLYGLLPPDDGTIRYEGRDFRVHRTAIRRELGVVTQDDTLDDDLTVAQNLRVYASYFRPRVADLDAQVEGLLERFALTGYRDASPKILSGGYRRRLLIARAMIHRPRMLFLDEPTTGLDPSARVEVWELIASMRAEGMGVVLTTHYMDEAERLSDTLVVLSDGRVLARGGAREITARVLGDHVLVFPVAAPEAAAAVAWGAAQGRPATRVLEEWRLPVARPELAEFAKGFPALAYVVREPSLDDLFLRLARRGAT